MNIQWITKALDTIEFFLADASRDNALRADGVLDYVFYWTRDGINNLTEAQQQRYTSLREETLRRLQTK